MASFDITVRTTASLHTSDAPSEFLSSYTGVITCTDDDTGEVTKVGKLTALRVHAGRAQDAGAGLYDVFVGHSREMADLYRRLYEPNGYGLRDRLVQRFEAWDPDLLVLDYVVLNPRWRKLKLGLLAVRRFVDLAGGGCGLAVSHLAPVRHGAAPLVRVPGSWLPRFGTVGDHRAAVVKLRRHFRQMGFERLGRTVYYALPLNKVVPGAAEFLGGPPAT